MARTQAQTLQAVEERAHPSIPRGRTSVVAQGGYSLEVGEKQSLIDPGGE